MLERRHSERLRRGRHRVVTICLLAVAAGLGGLGAYSPARTGHHRRVSAFDNRAYLEIETSYFRLPPGEPLDIETIYDRARVYLDQASRFQATALEVDAGYLPFAEDVSAAANPPADFRRSNTEPRAAVALTFDVESPNGGEARRTLERIMELLSEAGVRATFFVVGRWAEANPDALRRLAAAGHEIANHSSTHHCFANRPPAELRAELRAVNDIVLRVTGEPVAPLFRPPYGCIDDDGAGAAHEEGYRLAGWTASGQDANSGTRQASAVIARMARDLGPGGVVLLHTSRWISAEALPAILQILHVRQLDTVSLTELLRRHPESAARIERAATRPCSATMIAGL